MAVAVANLSSPPRDLRALPWFWGGGGSLLRSSGISLSSVAKSLFQGVDPESNADVTEGGPAQGVSAREWHSARSESSSEGMPPLGDHSSDSGNGDDFS